MNQTKTKILNCLRDNSRQSLTKISNKTNIPLSTVSAAMKKIEGVIHKYVPLLNYSKLGYQLKAHYIIKSRKTKFLQNPHINNAFTLSDNNYYLECVFRTFGEISQFKKQLKAEIIREMLITEEISNEAFKIQ